MCNPLSLLEKIKSLFRKSYGTSCINYLNDNILNLEKKLTSVKKSFNYDKDMLNDELKKKYAEEKQLQDTVDKYMIDISDLKNQLTALRDELKKAQEEIEIQKNTSKNKSKLTCDDIKVARKAHENGEKIKDIAKHLNVSVSTMNRALKCQTYKKCCKK